MEKSEPMQYAHVNGVRTAPVPKLRGTCCACSGQMVAKCGSRVIWHWAHTPSQACDPWWENETEWHREWKSHFPEDWREVVQFDPDTGEKHVADVRTASGLVIELQHSAMPPEEMRSREAFYQRMLWIVNARSFAERFEVSKVPLPHPESTLYADVVFNPVAHGAFWRRSEKSEDSILVQIHHWREIADEIQADYRGHHLYKWTRPHRVWFDATAPVYFEFGRDELLKLETIGELRTVQRTQRRALVADLLRESPTC